MDNTEKQLLSFPKMTTSETQYSKQREAGPEMPVGLSK